MEGWSYFSRFSTVRVLIMIYQSFKSEKLIIRYIRTYQLWTSTCSQISMKWNFVSCHYSKNVTLYLETVFIKLILEDKVKVIKEWLKVSMANHCLGQHQIDRLEAHEESNHYSYWNHSSRNEYWPNSHRIRHWGSMKLEDHLESSIWLDHTNFWQYNHAEVKDYFSI